MMDNISIKQFACITIFMCFTWTNRLNAQQESNLYHQNIWELSQVYVVSEKKTEQTLQNTTSTIRVITSEQIKQNGYLTLEDALAELPGFQFRNILGLNVYSFLRGLPRQNNAILVLIDGIQINELNSGGFYGGGQYNLSNVERIEVMYGPASVIYGTNAISGVINIVTKSPETNNQIVLNTALGSFNTYLTDISYSYIKNNTSLQLSGMYKTSNKADLTNGNNDNYWDDDLEVFETDYSFDAKLQHERLTIGLNLQNRRSSTSTYYPSINTVHKGYGTLWNLLLVNFYLKHNLKISDNIDLHSTIYNRNATILGNSVLEVTDTGCTAYYRPNDQIGIENIFEFKFGNSFNILAGTFAYWENLANGFSKSYSTEYFIQPKKPATPNKTSDELAGLFMQMEYGFLNFWRIIPSVRFEYNTSYKYVIIPRTSLIFDKERFNTKVIYARAFRAPKPWDFTDGIGNSNLAPEYFNSFELSCYWFASDFIKTEMSIFHNNLCNGLSKVYLDDDSFYWDNSGNSLTQGGEFSSTLSFLNFKSTINYTYYHSVYDSKKIIEEISPHTGMFGLDYTYKEHAKFGARLFYYGERKNPKVIKATNSEYVDQAFVVNLYLSLLNYKKTDFQIIIKNLTNTEYYHTSNIAPDRLRQPQLSLLFKLGYKINNL